MKTNPVYKREIMVSARSIRLALVLLVFNGILLFGFVQVLTEILWKNLTVW